MNNRNFKLSQSSRIVILICVVVLGAIFLLNYLNLKDISTLQHSVFELSTEDQRTIVLRKSTELLTKAEDHYRIYINTWEPSQKKLFLTNIDSAITDLNAINNSDTGFSKKLFGDISYKLVLYNAIANLKMMADTITQQPDIVSTETTLNSPIHLQQIQKSFFKDYFSFATDTLKMVGAKKKGFFKKLAYAFSNQDETITKEYSKGSPEEKKRADSVQHQTDSVIDSFAKKIRNYYQYAINKQLRLDKELRDKERSLAEKNLMIISEIDAKVNDLFAKALNNASAAKNDSRIAAKNAKSSLQKVSIFSLLCIIALIALLIYNIYRTNKYEEAILNSKTSAEKLAQLRARFLSNMSHEIRSPLTSIIGFTEQIAQHETDQQNNKYLDAIKISSGHLLNTVNDILDFSKLDAGKLTLDNEPFQLQKAINEVAFAFSLEAKKKGIALNVSSEINKNFCVNGDVHRFKQILFNLISNAIKFTDMGSIDILANTRSENSKNVLVTVCVKDTGIGIATDQLDLIFEEFAQAKVNNSLDKSKLIKGTGLGLPICKMLTELQNGSIKAESQPGKGSAFTVSIPYELANIKDVKDAESPAETLKPPAINEGTKKILVVEDNELNVMLISVLLKRMGHSFDVAIDGEEALNFFKKNYYGLILTDINIPKYTGVQITEIFRKDKTEQKASVPIVALTADTISEDFENYFKAGINKILIKPFNESEFREVVESYMNGEKRLN